MPVAIERIAFFGPHPAPGERLDCTVRIRRHEARAVVADLRLVPRRQGLVRRSTAGRTAASTPTIGSGPVMRYPEQNLLGETRPGGWIWFLDAYRVGADPRPAGAPLPRREASAPIYDAQPREDAARLALRPHRRQGRGARAPRAPPVFPVEIALENDAEGRPRVGAPARDLRVSIAHKGDAAVAIAAAGHDVGIDVERVEPRDRAFAEIAFSDDELRLIAPSDDRDEWLTRLWAAKEAVGKARGTGLAGRPARAAHHRPHRRAGPRRRPGVETRREGAHVVAWTS